MARPERNNVDYFPFYCEDGKKMYYLEETYGNDGFATFIKILRELAKTNYHYLDLSKKTTMMFLSAKCKIDHKILESIINDLVDLEKFDKTLWKENKIIWCQDFIDSIQDAYFKRKNKCITYDGLLHLLCSLGVRKPSKSKSIDTVNTQTILEDTILEETKENNNFNEVENLLEIRDKFIDNNNFKQECLNSKQWIETLEMQNTVYKGTIELYLNHFESHLITMEEQKESLKDFKVHFTRWFNKQDLSHSREKIIGKTNQI
jgi:hypothetical protein